MKIAHVVVSFLPQRSGTGNVAYHNARQLVARGHAVTVFVPSDSADSPTQIDGITVRRLRPIVRVGNAAMLLQPLWELRGFDLVHLHAPFYGGMESVFLACKLWRIPLVLTHHQDVVLPGWMGAISWLHDHTVGRVVYRWANLVCFTSRDYQRASRWGRVARFSAELPNGVATDQFDVVVSTENDYLLFVGGLDQAHYFKGVDVLLRALARLDNPPPLKVVGKGDLRESYRQLAAELGVTATFEGFVADDDLPTCYQHALATVLPSTTMGEAFGLVLAESLACGTPVIASDLAGVRSVVAHEVDGLLVRANDVDALAAAVARMGGFSAEKRQNMGRAGRKKVLEKYAWEQIGDRLAQLYAPLVQTREDKTYAMNVTLNN